MSIENSVYFDQHRYSTGSKTFLHDASVPRKRRDDTNFIFDQLFEGTLIHRSDERDSIRIGGRKNKNQILALTNALINKEKFLKGKKFFRDKELVRGLKVNVNHDEFVLVLRCDGRIVAMSEEAENHLDKSMRSLYTQCVNIFQCLDRTDGEKLRRIFDRCDGNEEHRLICTFRLPRGKRPSRTQEDVKTILMTGHFYSCEDSLCSDRLFVARCETFVSGSICHHQIKILLNEDLTINAISANEKEILGFSRNEMIGQSLAKFLVTEDFQRFQLKTSNFSDLFDFYTNFGDSRLTFFCQIRSIRERRSKSNRFSLIGQMIDPLMKSECSKMVENSFPSKINENNVNAESPTLSMGLLMFESELISSSQTLSNFVAPILFDSIFPLESFSRNEDFLSKSSFDNFLMDFDLN